MKTYYICYHNDEDGLASAAIIYEYLKGLNKDNKNNVKYLFYKVDYTMDLREILDKYDAGDEMYFVDYSFSNIDNLKYILELSTYDVRITWIDHHKTSYDIVYGEDKNYKLWKEKYNNFHPIINTNYCAAYLCYLYAYFDINYSDSEYEISDLLSESELECYVPLYIKYVDSWDTWKHNMPNTTEFNIGLRTIKRTPKNVISLMFNYNSANINKLFSSTEEDHNIIDKHMEKYIDNVIDKGITLKEYEDINNESLCNDYGFEFYITDKTNKDTKNYHCFALNKRGSTMLFGDRINNYDIVVPFKFNGTKYVYSLFTSKDDIDCCDLAKKLGTIDGLGGGGHIKAAGFQTFNQIIRSGCNIRISNKLFKKDEIKIQINNIFDERFCD